MHGGRRALAALGLVVLLVSSGCSLSTAFVHEARPATVDPGRVRAAGYEHVETTDLSFEQSVDVADVESVSLRGWLATYRKRDAGLRAPRLVVLSVPRFPVAGRSANPLAHLSDRQLVRRVLDLALLDFNLEKIEVAETGTVEMLGGETELVTYRGDSRPGEDAAVETTGYAHVASVERGEDLVVAVAVHSTTTDERDRVARLVEGLEYRDGTP